MTKTFKLAISVIVLIPVILIVVAGFYMQDTAIQKQDQLMKYYARRDELVAQQVKLASLVDQLNKTAESLAAQPDVPSTTPTPVTTPNPQPKPVVQPQPQPPAPVPVAPAPRPRVTRAS